MPFFSLKIKTKNTLMSCNVKENLKHLGIQCIEIPANFLTMRMARFGDANL